MFFVDKGEVVTESAAAVVRTEKTYIIKNEIACANSVFGSERYDLRETDKMTLDKLEIGKSAIITKVGGEGALRLRFLDMGLIPHTAVRMQKTAPSGDPIQILIRGYELTLRLEEASKIEIEETE